MKSKWLVLSAIGFELTGLIVAAIFLGRYLESVYPAKGLWVATGIILAFVGWLIHALFLIKKIQKQEE
jgi:hypothetical protein